MPYTTEYFASRERWRDWRIEAQVLIRLAHVERGARVLEIGCGGGGLLRMLRERGADAVGADTLDVPLRVARDTWRVTRGAAGQSETELLALPPVTHHLSRSQYPIAQLAQISADNKLPFSDNTFDAITSQHVIEHISDIDAALREWYRLLKRQGRLALATPNAHYPDLAHFADADHTHIFSLRELRAELARAGFTIEASCTVFPFLTHNRILRGVGVVGYNLFRFVPYFARRGRTILIGARKIE